MVFNSKAHKANAPGECLQIALPMLIPQRVAMIALQPRLIREMETSELVS